MTWIEAIILGIIQGLTEFLPVSSSGHLELGKAILGIDPKESLTFTVVVHGATVLSTMVVFRRDIAVILTDLLRKGWNEGKAFTMRIILSMIPVLIVGLTMKEQVEALFSGNLLLVGCMLILTATLLAFTYLFRAREKPITYANSFVMGIAQAFAVIPGLSRSGSTIAAGLMMGGSRELIARFSFIMVLIPVIGANVLDLKDAGSGSSAVPLPILVLGFIAAFISGLLACKGMIAIVKKGKLKYFALYCLLIGATAVTYHFLS
jgi:undecaprenyl-diphosphatase